MHVLTYNACTPLKMDKDELCILRKDTTVCPRSIDPFFIASNYINWVKTSWTYSKSDLAVGGGWVGGKLIHATQK